MTSSTDRPAHVDGELFDSAAAEGKRQSRSAKQQLDHWIRVGRAVSSHEPARSRVESALAGTLSLDRLTADEGVVFNAEISAAIDESLARSDYGEILAEQGVTTVGLDDAGNLVERKPDGPAPTRDAD